MLYITFHGGSTGCFPGKPAIQTIYVYHHHDHKGEPYAGTIVGPGPNELRDLQHTPDGMLYLVNSYKHTNEIWQITPDDGAPTGKLFTSGTIVPTIYHPFAIAFNSSMQICAISNQDTNVVVFVYGPAHQNAGQAMPVNPVLAKMSPHFLPGTFVASQNPQVPPNYSESPPPPVPGSQGGLATSPSSGSPSNSVRGIAFIGTTLYVADEPGNCIRMYDADVSSAIYGTYLGEMDDPEQLIQKPVHLLQRENKLYLSVSYDDTSSSADEHGKKHNSPSVLCYDTSAPVASALTTVVSDVHHPSGMTFDKDGNFYLACRTQGYVNKYDSSFTPDPNNPFLADLPDCPEFILYSHR